MSKRMLDIILYVLLGLAIVLSAVNLSLISARSEKVREAALIAEKESQPARMQLVEIAVSFCGECSGIASAIEGLKSKANITSERKLEFSSGEAKQLINKYGIVKLPAAIVLGEVNKSGVANLWKQGWKVEMSNSTHGTAVYASAIPPYSDKDGNVKGLVGLTQITDSSCPKCASLAEVISLFSQNGVKFSGEKTVDYAEANELIEKFGVEKIPALIISRDILEYPSIGESLKQLNATEKDGFYALHATMPPYRNIASGRIEGLVSVVYLNDSSCAKCYDVMVNKNIMERNFGIVITNSTTADVSSDYGKELISRYNITKAPVLIISPDAKAYSSFALAWAQVGDAAGDGWYVMRKPEVLGNYKDLEKGLAVNQFVVQSGEFEFQPSTIAVNKGELVKITFVNAGSVEHNFVIDEFNVSTGTLPPRTAESVEFVAGKAGKFSFYCSIHREQGMEGTIQIA